MATHHKEIIADDATESVDLLVRLRLPWLVLGLIGGVMASLIVSRYEAVLAQNIKLTFFMPLIVYIAAAVGNQTENIYVRNLGRKEVNLGVYFVKEISVGIIIGMLLGLISGVIVYIWLADAAIAYTIGLAMAGSVAVAPFIALTVSALLHKEHTDPAVGAGPFMTIIQDILSLLIYFATASVLLF